MSRWTNESIPNQSQRVAIVTGANSGLGFETAKVLAERGAEVVLACRNEERGQKALKQITGGNSGAKVRFMRLDLADLEQVASFAAEFNASYERLDLLINNAGVMFPPLTRTAQGHELQFGVNHLGHFALSARLFDTLAQTQGARVVTVSSLMHRLGRIDFDDLNFESRTYRTWPSYSQSKLANLLFSMELQRRVEAAGRSVLSLAAHPGWTGTELQRHSGVIRFFSGMLAMSPAQGALPTLRAATDESAQGGDYFGPNGFFEVRGYPDQAYANAQARREDDAKRLWEESERLAGVRFAMGSQAQTNLGAIVQGSRIGASLAS